VNATLAKPPYTTTDATPARALVRRCMDAGIGLRRFAELSGVPYSTLSRLMYCGQPAVTAHNAAQITRAAGTVLADPAAALAAGAATDATGTRRRAQALIARGHTGTGIAPLVPMCHDHLEAIVSGRVTMVTARVARGMCAAYDQLWDQPPPTATPGQRRAATMARRRAERNNWPVPMAWDDDEIDNPDTPAPVGWRRKKSTPSAELAADYAELEASHPLRAVAPELVRRQIAERLGLRRDTLNTALARAAHATTRKQEVAA